MDREIFEKHKGNFVKLGIKPTNFAIDGHIDEVFETCIAFRTKQKTSYLEFDAISSIVPLGDE